MRVRIASLVAVAGVAAVASAQNVGPSTSTTPYVLPTVPGVSTTSILTVGDTIGGYRMVGIPDGLGAFSNDDGTFTLLMNHELGATAGVTRAHGQTGSFVSRWNINANAGNLVVNSGRDHNTASADVYEYSAGAWTAGATTPFSRLCSGDLAAPGAYAYTDVTGQTFGTSARIYMNGEETGAEGRAFAHIATGANANQSWQLPHLGRFSWENSIASPFSQRKTLVMGTDDSTPGQLYMYVGEKQTSGNDIERAGLTNGNLFGVRVSGLPTESRGTSASGRFDLYNHGDVSSTSGSALNSDSNANNVTNFLRPEDGQWDPRPGHENDFYFVTTDRFNQPGQLGTSRLYRMRFDDITNPTAGGSIEMLLDGSVNGMNMMDNMTIDSLGRILIQEDIGNNDALGKIWLYDIDTHGYGIVAQHDANFFAPGAANFLTRDEESSGIIDAGSILGQGWFLLDVQAHYGIAGELVEGGQLLSMYIDPSIIPAPGALALVGMGGLLAARRRR